MVSTVLGRDRMQLCRLKPVSDKANELDYERTILESSEAIVEAGICQQSADLTRRRISRDALPGLEAEDIHIILVVKHY